MLSNRREFLKASLAIGGAALSSFTDAAESRISPLGWFSRFHLEEQTCGYYHYFSHTQDRLTWFVPVEDVCGAASTQEAARSAFLEEVNRLCGDKLLDFAFKNKNFPAKSLQDFSNAAENHFGEKPILTEHDGYYLGSCARHLKDLVLPYSLWADRSVMYELITPEMILPGEYVIMQDFLKPPKNCMRGSYLCNGRIGLAILDYKAVICSKVK